MAAQCTALGNKARRRKFFGMTNHPVTRVLTSIGTLTSRPAAFLILLVYAVLWMIFERQSLDWHGAATLFTWAMTLFIQRAEHRDTQAIHAKLDEILRSDHNASNITRIDDEEPEEIEKHRHRKQEGD
jgi:low affinity Fe/Cu permease